MNDVPVAQQVICDLQDLIPVAYGGLEYGVAVARDHFEQYDMEYQTYLFSDIVRHHTRDQLHRNGHELELEQTDLPNGGLQVNVDGKIVRLRKEYRGGITAPATGAQRLFYGQQLSLFTEPVISNYFLVWNVTKDYELIPALQLACPRETAMRFPDLAECHWYVQVPDALLRPRTIETPYSPDDFEDLDYTLPADDISALG